MNKLDLTKPVQTRDGKKARIICTDAIGTYPVVALIKTKNTLGEVIEYSIRTTIEGKCHIDNEYCDDLINIPTLDISKPIKTKGGKNARIICTDCKGQFPIIALIEHNCNNGNMYEEAKSYTIDGNYFNDGRVHELDLINI